MKLVKNMHRYIIRLIAFWHWVVVEFFENRCLLRASALTYTTLLALVPLMVVILAAFSMLPFFDHVSHQLQSFIFNNFVPHTGKVVQKYLFGFRQHAFHLPVIGIAFLFVTAIMMMMGIERNINDIWHLRTSRRLSASVLLYWATLTIGPLLLGLSIAISSYITSSRWLKIDLSHFAWLAPLPFVCTVIGIGFLYFVVPRCEVKIKHAFLGALFAASIFELAKRAFSFYVAHFPTYQLIYGALASIPLFLLWIYCSWVIFIIGALIVNGLRLEQGQRHFAEPIPPFILSFRLIGHLRKAYLKGKSLSLAQLLHAEPCCKVEELQCVLDNLLKAKLIHMSVKDEFIMSTDLHKMNVYDLYHKTKYYLPKAAVYDACEEAAVWQDNLNQVLLINNKQQLGTLNVPLDRLYGKPYKNL
jgi:membrane protein